MGEHIRAIALGIVTPPGTYLAVDVPGRLGHSERYQRRDSFQQSPRIPLAAGSIQRADDDLKVCLPSKLFTMLLQVVLTYTPNS
jgi:hypothetical protein